MQRVKRFFRRKKGPATVPAAPATTAPDPRNAPTTRVTITSPIVPTIPKVRDASTAPVTLPANSTHNIPTSRVARTAPAVSPTIATSAIPTSSAFSTLPSTHIARSASTSPFAPFAPAALAAVAYPLAPATAVVPTVTTTPAVPVASTTAVAPAAPATPAITWPDHGRPASPQPLDQSSDTRVDLPFELWTDIWLLLSARDRTYASHVCRLWRERAISSPSLWAEFVYHERATASPYSWSEFERHKGEITGPLLSAVNRYQGIGTQNQEINIRLYGVRASPRQYRLAALRAYLERSSPRPFSLAIELHSTGMRSTGKQPANQSLISIAHIIGDHRQRIARLVLGNFSSACARQFLMGGRFPMLFGSGGCLELSTNSNEQSPEWTVEQVASISGGSGPRRLKISSRVQWTAVSNQNAQSVRLPGVKELLGPLVIQGTSHTLTICDIFHNVQAVDITIEIDDTDSSAPSEVLACFARLRSLRIDVIPRASSTTTWTDNVLDRVLPKTTSGIDDLVIGLPRMTNDQLTQRAFASFRDFDLTRANILSLEVSNSRPASGATNADIYIWTLKSACSNRVRSVVMPTTALPAAAHEFWSVVVAAPPPAVRNLSIPVSALTLTLCAANARHSTIESLEVEITDISPSGKIAEIDATLLPSLPQLKRLCLWSSCIESQQISIESLEVQQVVQRFCGARVLPVLDVSCLRVEGWPRGQLEATRALVETLLV